MTKAKWNESPKLGGWRVTCCWPDYSKRRWEYRMVHPEHGDICVVFSKMLASNRYHRRHLDAVAQFLEGPLG